MEAGQALNALIAEKVMGWAVWENYPTGDWDGPADVTFFAPWNDGTAVSVYTPDDDGDVSFYFDPSRHIDDAWRVVRELERRGATVVYRTTGPRLTRNRIEITACVNGRDSLFAADGEDAPVAICRAALAAVERT